MKHPAALIYLDSVFFVVEPKPSTLAGASKIDVKVSPSGGFVVKFTPVTENGKTLRINTSSDLTNWNPVAWRIPGEPSWTAPGISLEENQETGEVTATIPGNGLDHLFVDIVETSKPPSLKESEPDTDVDEFDQQAESPGFELFCPVGKQ